QIDVTSLILVVLRVRSRPLQLRQISDITRRGAALLHTPVQTDRSLPSASRGCRRQCRASAAFVYVLSLTGRFYSTSRPTRPSLNQPSSRPTLCSLEAGFIQAWPCCPMAAKS